MIRNVNAAVCAVITVMYGPRCVFLRPCCRDINIMSLHVVNNYEVLLLNQRTNISFCYTKDNISILYLHIIYYFKEYFKSIQILLVENVFDQKKWRWRFIGFSPSDIKLYMNTQPSTLII